MKPETEAILNQYLLDHENDIVWGINDFEELFDVFFEIVGREPSMDALKKSQDANIKRIKENNAEI